MKSIRNAGFFARVLVWCSFLYSPFAAASMVDNTPVDIATLSGGYHLAVMVQPSALVLEDFRSSIAGTITLTAKTFSWGDLLSVLSTNVFIDGGAALALTGPGTLAFDVGANQLFSTSLRATAAGPRGYALAGLDLSFVPKVSQVPLPAGLWLLASGIGLIGAARKKRLMSPAANKAA